jgi:hypothetical protein
MVGGGIKISLGFVSTYGRNTQAQQTTFYVQISEDIENQ